MYFSSNNFRLLVIKLLIFCLIYDHQWSVSSHSIANKTGIVTYILYCNKFNC